MLEVGTPTIEETGNVGDFQLPDQRSTKKQISLTVDPILNRRPLTVVRDIVLAQKRERKKWASNHQCHEEVNRQPPIKNEEHRQEQDS